MKIEKIFCKVKNSFFKYKEYVYAFIIISFVVFIADWKLLFLKAAMKWDIVDLHLIFATFLSDCLREGHLFLWNPMINYGFPHYSQIGGPLWYPLTLLFGFCGYSLLSTHLEYVINVIFAGFFMFVFIFDLLREKEEYKFFVSLIAGLIYSFSGLFISNAEHLTIIVSGALIPLEFFLLRRYINTNNLKILLLLGFVTGLNILGGYFVMLIFLFVTILPYIFYEYFMIDKNLPKVIKKTILLYVLLIIFTFLSSAISIIPFIHVTKFLTRADALPYPTARGGSISLICLFTMLIPGMSKYTYLYGDIDISMIDMYLSLIIPILSPLMILKITRKTFIYLSLALFSFLMLMGSYHILHPVFYQFVPTFNKFRFPSLWRAYFIFFVITLFSVFLQDLLNNRFKEDWYKINKICKYMLFFCGMILFFTFPVYALFYNKINPQLGKDFLQGLFLVSLIIFFYRVIFYLYYKNDNRNRRIIIFLIICLIFEILTFHYYDFGALISIEDPDYTGHLSNITKNRIRTIDFKKIYTTSLYPALTNMDIIYNRTLEVEGYNCFVLKEIPIFHNTYFRYMSVQKPIVYFTSKINYTDNIINRLNDLDFDIESILLTRDGIDTKEKFKLKDLDFHNKLNIFEKLIFEGPIIKIPCQDLKDPNYIPVLKLDFISLGNLAYPVNLKYIDSSGNIINQINSSLDFEKGFNLKYIYLPQNKDVATVVIDFGKEFSLLKLYGCEFLQVLRDKLENNIKIERFLPNQIDITLDVEQPGYLVLQQSVYPGWYALDNGSPVNIERVNYLFRGVKLDKGFHKVHFKFQPADFYTGAVITFFYLLVCIIVIVLDLFKGFKNKLLI